MPTIVSKTMNSTHKLEHIGTMHYVYLGGPDGGHIDSEYEQAAMDECSALFTSFSVTRATGMFRGKREETMIFHIAISDRKDYGIRESSARAIRPGRRW